MALSREEQHVFDTFLSIVYRLDDSVIDRAILALMNEKKIKLKRQAFIAQLIRSGMTPEEAAESVLNFQRESEGLAVSKKSLLDQKEWAIEAVQKAQEEEKLNPKQTRKPTKKPTDDLEEVIQEFEDSGGFFAEDEAEE